MQEIDNNQDLLDSRDINDRLNELESDFADWRAEQDEIDEEFDKTSEMEWEPTPDSNFPDYNELIALRDLVEQCENYSDWRNGETLISEEYFTEYVKDLVVDIGDLPGNLPEYIENNIDWEGVATDWKQDYMEVDFDGVTYYIRTN